MAFFGPTVPSELKRSYGKGDLHFLTFSCYHRRRLLKTAGARNVFLKELGRVRNETRFRLIGYVVMPEHVQLLISEPNGTGKEKSKARPRFQNPEPEAPHERRSALRSAVVGIHLAQTRIFLLALWRHKI